jgi:hypothetical protein
MVEDAAQEDPKVEPEAPIVEAESVLEEKPEELSSEHPAEPEAIEKGEETVDDATETEAPKDAPIEVVRNLFQDIFPSGFLEDCGLVLFNRSAQSCISIIICDCWNIVLTSYRLKSQTTWN